MELPKAGGTQNKLAPKTEIFSSLVPSFGLSSKLGLNHKI